MEYFIGAIGTEYATCGTVTGKVDKSRTIQHYDSRRELVAVDGTLSRFRAAGRARR
ncbi:protein of unknown function [Methylocaldum szegediense]|uniref:Uncharacterized protein n=1 Tax=Methylocaldum szegediense TaxID=73780 RepID=A0ABM9I3I5_9GAMM|nr:protein of unknown function [Methylocaldum szegediense]